MSLIATLLFVAAAPFAQSERRVERELPADVARALVVHSQGDCKVVATGEHDAPSAELHLVASGGGDAAVEKRFLELANLEVVVEGASETPPSRRVTIRSLFPPKNQQVQGLSFAANLVVKLPASVAVEVQNSFGLTVVEKRDAAVKVGANAAAGPNLGPIEVRSVHGTVEVDQQYGEVKVADVVGDVTVRGKSSAVTVERTLGAVDVRTNGGAVKVDGATKAHVEDRLKPVELLHVTGDATVVAAFSDVTAKDVGGSLTIEGGNGVLVVDGVGRSLAIQHKSGKVDARHVKGSATVLGNLSDVTLADVGGEALVRSPHSRVTVSGVGGKLVAENSERTLEIVDARGDVEASAHGGALAVRWTKWPAGDSHEPTGRQVSLESDRGGIELELPDSAAALLDVTSTSGKVECAFEGMTFVQNGTARTGTLELGDRTKLPKTKLHATCVGGAIRVRRTGVR